ncbi:putative hydrolase rbbp9 [Modicella reniformis]|uniref:Hydrolase rbbp9 n=1 Tax=Modicella reniformis TaxID=1440133 RepID=A0A9P6MC11_9FUNG|nr:putative hydrolase rbbp9 [Modicella reniformis]
MSRIILIPGNGVYNVNVAMWYPSAVNLLAQAIDDKTGQQLFPKGGVLQNFPDPLGAHEDIWIKFMKDDIKISEKDVVVGHSSGAAAIMRYIEANKVKGVVIVSAYHSDLGDSTERESGYFNRPWDWDAMARNTCWITQFSSSDDPLVPIEEQRTVASKIPGIEYIELQDRGHFNRSKVFPELVANVIQKMS